MVGQLSEIAKRKQAYLERVRQEAKIEKENLAILGKIKSRQYSSSSMTATSKAKANILDTSKNEILRRKNAFLETVQREAEYEQRNKPLAEYLKAQTQKQLFPDAINLYSKTTAIDVIQKNTETSQVDAEKESELAFNNLKTVMNPAYARNLRDELQQLDDSSAYPLKLIILLNSYWSELREEIVKRFRAGGANPDIVYQFIVGYMENNIINKFATKTPLKAEPISFKPTVIEEDPNPPIAPAPVDSLTDKFSYPIDKSIPESLLRRINKANIVKEQIMDFIKYSLFNNSTNEFLKAYRTFDPSDKQTREQFALFFEDMVIGKSVEPQNIGDMDPARFDEFRRLILGVSSKSPASLLVRRPPPLTPAPSPPIAPAPSSPTANSSSPTANSSSPASSSSSPTANSSKPSAPTGNGLKKKKHSKHKSTNNPKKKLKYIIKGKGAQNNRNKEKPFYVDVDSLNRNVLSVKYRTSRKYKINPMVISDGEKHMIIQIITYKQFNDQIYSKLSGEEKRRIELLIHELKMDNELEGYDPFASTKDLYNQLQIIRGQIEAGNNNPSLKAIARKIISELYALKRLTKTQASQILMELW